MLLLPIVCVVMRSAKQFCLQCTFESLQWRQWSGRRWMLNNAEHSVHAVYLVQCRSIYVVLTPTTGTSQQFIKNVNGDYSNNGWVHNFRTIHALWKKFRTFTSENIKKISAVSGISELHSGLPYIILRCSVLTIKRAQTSEHLWSLEVTLSMSWNNTHLNTDRSRHHYSHRYGMHIGLVRSAWPPCMSVHCLDRCTENYNSRK